MDGRVTREARRLTRKRFGHLGATAHNFGYEWPNEFGILCDNVSSKRPDFLVIKQCTRLIDVSRFHAHPNQVVDYYCSIKFVRDCITELYAFRPEPLVTF